jgi:hypothetical protein
MFAGVEGHVSEDETYAINGKMVADYVQAKRDLATLNRKANDLSSVLNRIVGSLETSTDSHHARTLSGKSWDELLAKYPSPQEISSVASEIVTLTARRFQLAASLREIGLEPKD